jgi:hypothetical protein
MVFPGSRLSPGIGKHVVYYPPPKLPVSLQWVWTHPFILWSLHFNSWVRERIQLWQGQLPRHCHLHTVTQTFSVFFFFQFVCLLNEDVIFYFKELFCVFVLSFNWQMSLYVLLMLNYIYSVEWMNLAHEQKHYLT